MAGWGICNDNEKEPKRMNHKQALQAIAVEAGIKLAKPEAVAEEVCRPLKKAREINRIKFTMIEMLVVIAIIVILAGMTFGIMRMVWQKNARAGTTATIAQVEDALERHHKDYGYFPEQEPATDDIAGHRLSMAMVANWKRSGTSIPYIDPEGLRNDGTWILDYWKKPIRYRSPGIVNRARYDIWSAGPDKEDGLGGADLDGALTRGKCDDVRNW